MKVWSISSPVIFPSANSFLRFTAASAIALSARPPASSISTGTPTLSIDATPPTAACGEESIPASAFSPASRSSFLRVLALSARFSNHRFELALLESSTFLPNCLSWPSASRSCALSWSCLTSSSMYA